MTEKSLVLSTFQRRRFLSEIPALHGRVVPYCVLHGGLVLTEAEGPPRRRRTRWSVDSFWMLPPCVRAVCSWIRKGNGSLPPPLEIRDDVHHQGQQTGS